MANCSACGHSKEEHRPVCSAIDEEQKWKLRKEIPYWDTPEVCNCEYFEVEVPNNTYCDGCLTAAYDEIGNGLEAQIQLLDHMADLLPDHLCDHGEEPDIPCDCGAHSFNKTAKYII